ncbi:hypothetical protein Halhy_5412 [Haliscomenobacter hydrossis DSM 1100]|uniref:Uncharacterized protein n=1 Tax=Haliscomenobacter hydrossis (strain ATCC 27775 / DSM 1100 / LMG 10767 / O) TaxID=760192 RepID=F4KQZ9_HALH1|nr:hypothetical protein Halhy_5412 [Haliscomenobacter hydrossis DSM 1100]
MTLYRFVPFVLFFVSFVLKNTRQSMVLHQRCALSVNGKDLCQRG